MIRSPNTTLYKKAYRDSGKCTSNTLPCRGRGEKLAHRSRDTHKRLGKYDRHNACRIYF